MAKQAKTLFALLGAMLVIASPASAEKIRKEAPSPEQKEMMDKMMKAGEPGPEHKMLAKMVGKWDVEIKEWQGPNKDPKISQAKSTYKSKYKGRFLKEYFKGMMGDMPFKGELLIGYDKLAKKYKSTWIENMSTSILEMEGTYDVATKTFTSTGSYIDPMDNQTKTLKIVGKHVDDNSSVHTFYQVKADGSSTKWMEMTYTRSKT